MILMKRLFAYAPIVALLAGSIPALAGQEPEKGAKKGETTITGCLNKGTSEGQYVLTDAKSGKQIMVTGPPELEKHASNHTVKLTGTRTTEGGMMMFNVTKVEHVSGTCQAPAEKK